MSNSYHDGIIVPVTSTLTLLRRVFRLQSNLKAFMEHVRKSDVQKISALTNKGFDPNYVDRSSGGSLLDHSLNPLMGTLKPQSNEPLYSNTVIGTLAVDGWAVTFGTARRGLGAGLQPTQAPPRSTKCNSPPCTNFILFDVAI